MLMIHADTKKPMAKVLEDVAKACAAHQFGVLGTIDLKAKLHDKGQEYPRAVVVFEVCNPEQAKRALEADASVSTMLPCRISAYEMPGGTVRLSTVRPTAMIGAMGVPALDLVAGDVERVLDAILKDAAR
jgi:uncharacterized protein (DUF302 family)